MTAVASRQSFWLETAGAFEVRPEWVVTGGWTSPSSAVGLRVCPRRSTSRSGSRSRVVLLEAGSIACGASGRNAGFAMTLFGLELGVTVLRYGKERAKQADEYMVRAVNYTRELVTRLGIDCDYDEHGMMTVRPIRMRAAAAQAIRAGAEDGPARDGVV